MRVVVDTNVLLPFFKFKSFTRELIISNKSLELIAPEKGLGELVKYAVLVLSKSGATKKEFKEAFIELMLRVNFISVDKYKDKLRKAESLARGWPEEKFKEFMDDIDFVALALKEGCAIWSHDELLKKQSAVNVLRTEELSRLLSAITEP